MATAGRSSPKGQTVFTQSNCYQINTVTSFSSLFLLSKYTRKRWQGKATGFGGSPLYCAGKLDHRQTHRQLETGHTHQTAALLPPKRQCYTTSIVLTDCQTSGTSFPQIDRAMKLLSSVLIPGIRNLVIRLSQTVACMTSGTIFLGGEGVYKNLFQNALENEGRRQIHTGPSSICSPVSTLHSHTLFFTLLHQHGHTRTLALHWETMIQLYSCTWLGW